MALIPQLFLGLILGMIAADNRIIESSASNAVSDFNFIQTNRNVINGVVTDIKGQPLNRMRVELLNEVEMSVMQVYTDTTGRYAFRSLTTGTFIVKVHTNGIFAGRSARVNIYSARANGGAHYEQLDFVLKTIDEEKSPSAPTNAGATFAQNVPEEAEKVYERAVKLLENEKQTAQGISLLKEAISIFPTYYLAIERLGIEILKGGDFDAARATLAKAVGINPNGASSLYALGVIQYQSREWQESVISLRRSLVLSPGSPNAPFTHYYLGLGYLKIDKPRDAEINLKKAYELGRDRIPSDVHLHLAQLYSNSKRYKEAADELGLFLKKAPDARDADNIKNLIKRLKEKARSNDSSSSGNFGRYLLSVQ